MGADSDMAIVEGLKAGGGQRRIFEGNLYKSFFYFIRQGVRKYGISEEDASSAYSDTIISVINNIIKGSFEGRSALKSYGYKIFSNKCVDLLRKDTTNKGKVNQAIPIDSLVFELPDQARTAIQQLLMKEERNYLMERLIALGEKCRQILLFFEDGYSDKDIAGFMEYNSADVVKTSRLRCLEKLKKKVNIEQTVK
ncbi:RNA polymerase sigma factor [Pedobacter caeni]|uniref:RNA polymerase sigma-70 factor, ECF subfamily n=1 Tax=Pedobacter caeni TaxID=288992 RepID=A0A1M4WY62_9SPHI|nr:sigma-70 family RNA polymerase sigma factor [Pedobacter caeni]SHE86148.1 RNA polymerase sigma-70 factor, ECF subfamily [Pedobacter caeni]